MTIDNKSAIILFILFSLSIYFLYYNVLLYLSDFIKRKQQAALLPVQKQTMEKAGRR